MRGVEANNKKIARNTFFLYGRMLFVLVVSLYTSRVILNTLGVSDFGLFNVVGGFVSLFGFLNATLSSSMSRFYNYEGGLRGDDGVRSVYTTGLYVHLLLAALLFVVLETFGLWYINNVMVIPTGRLQAANILFQFAVLSMILVILQIPYISAIMSYEYMDYYAIVSIMDVVLKLAIVLALPYIPYDKLISFASLTLLMAIVNFLLYFIFAKARFSTIKIQKYVDKSLFKSFLSFSGWNLLGTFAYMLRGQGVNMILNLFFGTVINAARGVAFQINGAISGFSQNISTAFRPQIVDAYSKGNQKRVDNLFFTESKICFCLILVLIVPVIIEMDYLLCLWLGDVVPEYASVFAILVLVDLLIHTLNTPVTQVTFATGKIVKYQICSAIVNIMLLPACWLFLRLGYDSVIVFILTIVFSLINQIACLVCMHEVFVFSVKRYLKDVLLPLSMAVLILPIMPVMLNFNMSQSLWRLVLVCIVDVVVAVPLCLFFVFSNDERKALFSFLKKKKK